MGKSCNFFLDRFHGNPKETAFWNDCRFQGEDDGGFEIDVSSISVSYLRVWI